MVADPNLLVEPCYQSLVERVECLFQKSFGGLGDPIRGGFFLVCFIVILFSGWMKIYIGKGARV